MRAVRKQAKGLRIGESSGPRGSGLWAIRPHPSRWRSWSALGRGGTQSPHTCLLTQATLPSVLVPLLTDQKRGRPSPAFMASVQPDPSGPAAHLAQPSKASPFPCGLSLPSLHSPLRVHGALLGAMPRGDTHPALPILEPMASEGGTHRQVHWGLEGAGPGRGPAVRFTGSWWGMVQ